MSTNCLVKKLKDSVDITNPENLYYKIMNLISCSKTTIIGIDAQGTPYYIEEGGIKTEFNTSNFTNLPTGGGKLWVPKYKTTSVASLLANDASESPIAAMDVSEFFNSEHFPNLVYLVIANPQGLMTGNIMTFADRPFTRIQLNGVNVNVSGEIKDFIKAQCAFRTSDSLTFQLYSYVTFDGKNGNDGAKMGDVNGTVTYSATGATFVCTGGTAVKGTYEYTKATDTWVKTAD